MTSRDRTCCMSCAKAFCCSCGVGAPPDPDDVVVVVVESVAGVLVVAVVDVVVLVVVEDAEDEEAAAEDGWPVGLKIRPGPTCGIPIVLQTYCCHELVSSCKRQEGGRRGSWPTASDLAFPAGELQDTNGLAESLQTLIRNSLSLSL